MEGETTDDVDLPVLPPSVPATPAPPPPPLPPALTGAPASTSVAAPAEDVGRDEDDDEDGGDGRLLADVMATRNVPRSQHSFDLGLATKEQSASTQLPFVRPDLEPMGPSTTALLVGRVLIAIAALLVGLGARRGADGQEQAEGFWPVAISAGVFAVVGVAGLVFWSATLAENARRLKTRTATSKAMGWVWILPIAWIVVSCLTYLQVDIDGDLDPMPGVAAIGWALTLAIAYGRLQGVFRALTRRPPILWVTAFPLDLLALGLIWWRLSDWPSPLGTEVDHVRLTANVAFGAAAALALNALVFVWLAQRGSNSVFERLGRLEANHQADDDHVGPAWFQAGLAARQALAPPVVPRPLISTRHLATAVAVMHVIWGVAMVVLGIFLAMLAFEYSDLPVFLGDELVVDDADTTRIAVVGGIVGLSFFAAVAGHGIWAGLSAVNGRRVTVHSPNPGTFAIAFAPMPLLTVTGLIVGGRLGYWLVVAGLSIGFFGLLLVNQMLMALSARLGGVLAGFSRWSLCLTLTYLAGVVVNLLFFQTVAQLGVYATLSFVQGVLIAIGGFVGLRAMRGLEATVRGHRQLGRAPS